MASGALPDLLIIDIEMPEMDGLTFLKTLRTKPQTQYLPVIVFTACSDPAVISEAQQLGASEYWVKARFDFTELPRRLNRYIASAEDAETTVPTVAPPKVDTTTRSLTAPVTPTLGHIPSEDVFGSNAGVD